MNNVELFVTTKDNSTNKKGKHQVFILNDNTTTFDVVIEVLQDVCGHNYLQAGQCATITHNTGRCSIFVDTYDECNEVLRLLLASNIKAELHKYKPVSHDKGNKKTDN